MSKPIPLTWEELKGWRIAEIKPGKGYYTILLKLVQHDDMKHVTINPAMSDVPMETDPTEREL